MSTSEATEAPPPHLRYRRALHVRSAFRELVQARPVMLSIAERDLRSRYSQMVLGFAWDVIGPLALMIVITVFLKRATGIRTPGLPTPLFTYVALLPWSFFQGSVSGGGTSLISNNSLLNKVYAPREVFPLANIGEQVVDTVAASTALVALMVVFQRGPNVTMVWAPIPLAIALVFTTAVTLFVAGLTVYFRDMRQAIPIVLQLGLFFNPIAYDLAKLAPGLRVVMVTVNPLAAAIDGLRRCTFYDRPPQLGLTLIAATVACVELVVAYVAFKQMETGFADVA